MTLAARFAAAVDDIFRGAPPRRIGLAVSGGGDSMALLHLAHGWAPAAGVSLQVATVDHALRASSADEAGTVAEAAAGLGLPHTILTWRGWGGAGNLQDAARSARRELLAAWAGDRGIDAVLTGHTMDDQAETLLLRLARGSGVDGLCGMPERRGTTPAWARPLLAMRRGELRAWLAERGVPWIEDPSNDDPAFDRVKARRLLADLGYLGLTVERLAATAAHMRRARAVLDAAADRLCRDAVRQEAGDLLIDLRPFADAAADTQTRLLAAALQWVSGNPYRPRFAALERLLAAPGGVLHGCLLQRDAPVIRITRELAAIRQTAAPADATWDGRWRLDGPAAADLEVRALGPGGLRTCPDWRATGLPPASLHATPAVWRGADLVAAPVAGLCRGWRWRLVEGRDVFSICDIPR